MHEKYYAVFRLIIVVKESRVQKKISRSLGKIFIFLIVCVDTLDHIGDIVSKRINDY